MNRFLILRNLFCQTEDGDRYSEIQVSQVNFTFQASWELGNNKSDHPLAFANMKGGWSWQTEQWN
jgi:hypothetical protein